MVSEATLSKMFGLKMPPKLVFLLGKENASSIIMLHGNHGISWKPEKQGVTEMFPWFLRKPLWNVVYFKSVFVRVRWRIFFCILFPGSDRQVLGEDSSDCLFACITGWWQLKYFLCSPRNPGEMIQFDEHIFQMGWNHQLDYHVLIINCKYNDASAC